MDLPKSIRPFSDTTFADLQVHLRELRRLFDWPGIPYHDAQAPAEHRYNRWAIHNPPLGRALHHRADFIAKISETVGEPVKPSYCFASFYGPDGFCPRHTDRPQCRYTCDLMVEHNAHRRPWHLYVEAEPYVIRDGDGLVYSGTQQAHFRDPMHADSDGTFANLMFFHFVPIGFQGPLD